MILLHANKSFGYPILLHDSILVCANMAKGTLYELMISLQSLDLSSYPSLGIDFWEPAFFH